MTTTDTIVVGAGPIGIELAVALTKAGIDYVQFDAGQIGSTIAWWAPQTRFFSSAERIAIAGVPIPLNYDQSKVTREEYLAYLRAVVAQFELPVRTFERVESVQRLGDGEGDGFRVTTNRHGVVSEWRCRRIVFAKGNMDAPLSINVPGEELPHVRHYFVEPHTFFGRRVLIVGSKNSAAEAAVRCHHGGARVSMAIRGDALSESIKYWVLPELKGLIKKDVIRGYFGTQVEAISPTHVTLRPHGGDAFEVAADDVLLMTGYVADMSLLESLGVDMVPGTNTPTLDEATMMTSVDNVYVAGTATAGTQRHYTVFIENTHVHVDRIVASIRGETIDAPTPQFAQPES